MITRDSYITLKGKRLQEARKELREIVISNLRDDGLEALQTLYPGWFQKRLYKGIPQWKAFADMFNKVGQKIDELTVFKQLRLGRSEVLKCIKRIVEMSPKNDIKWISFDTNRREYTLYRIGPNTLKKKEDVENDSIEVI
jgi:hypothetical protein